MFEVDSKLKYKYSKNRYAEMVAAEFLKIIDMAEKIRPKTKRKKTNDSESVG